MAEAAVEDRPPQRFYCHMCNVQFQHASADFTCPHCSDGFIEELQEIPEVNDEMVDDDDWEDDDGLEEDRRPGRTRSDGSRPGRRTLTRLASSNLRQQVPFEHLLQDFIVNLGVGVNWGTGGNMQLFLGNPGDYAWGREGLDAIVTQLLNQMDSTGPPPVSKAVIDALPVVRITSDQCNSKLQCSVCWEDFVVGENVRQLPCQHVYHEPCIRPWLELHGTCPICRQNLTGPSEGEKRDGEDSAGQGGGAEDTGGPGGNDSGGSGGASGGGNSLSFNSVLRALFQPPRTTSSGTSSSSLESNEPMTRSRSQSDSSMM